MYFFKKRGYNDTTIHFLYIIDIIMEGKLKKFQERKDVMILGINSSVKTLPSQNSVYIFYKTRFQISWLDICCASEQVTSS